MTVRLLVNENFPAPSVASLRAAGWDVVSIAELFSGMDDAGVIALAARENRWLVTFDRDYWELLFAHGLEPPPAVILLRVSSYRPEEPAGWIMRLAKEPQTLQGMFIVFDGTSIRSRPFIVKGGRWPAEN